MFYGGKSILFFIFKKSTKKKSDFQKNHPMTKLKFKIKQGAKKRAHRNKVAKRRVQRDKIKTEAKQQKEKEQEEETEFMQMVREAQERQGIGSNLQQMPTTLLGQPSGNGREAAFRGVAAASATKKGNHNVTRKQMKRKEKMREKGEALSEQRVEKIMGKMQRVKTRARFRNSDLKN